MAYSVAWSYLQKSHEAALISVKKSILDDDIPDPMDMSSHYSQAKRIMVRMTF